MMKISALAHCEAVLFDIVWDGSLYINKQGHIPELQVVIAVAKKRIRMKCDSLMGITVRFD